MIDWQLAQRIAGQIAGAGDTAPLAGDLDEICVDARERVVGYAEASRRARSRRPRA